MSLNLSSEQLTNLIKKVFAPKNEDEKLLLIVDIPNDRVRDNDDWKDRRRIAFEWKELLEESKANLEIDTVELIYYENTGNNNADLPAEAFLWTGSPTVAGPSLISSEGIQIDFEDSLAEADIILALTEFSATAPLKVLAPKYNFRAATMGGFNRSMLPALSIDYELVHEKVMRLKKRLDDAIALEMKFQSQNETFDFFVDLRHRKAHASSGLLRECGVAGNLPSGETYIVPYEGELAETSQTAGKLPVQFGDEVVVYEITNNRATKILSQGPVSETEKQALTDEPAYGNIAEIGFGVLQPFGIKPIGEILLDEKLGLHIAFGRSDHFGGATSPQDFRNPENVVHIDRVYIPEIQNKVEVKEVILIYPGEERELIMKDNEYLILMTAGGGLVSQYFI